MTNIFIYQYIIENKPTDDFRKNQETFKKAYGPYQITERTRDSTKCFHPQGKLGFQGIWSMEGWGIKSKKNAQAFKKHTFAKEQGNKGGMIVFPQEIKNLLRNSFYSFCFLNIKSYLLLVQYFFKGMNLLR